MEPLPPNVRFRQARERAGLSLDQVAAQCGIDNIGGAAIRDIETHEDELSTVHSPMNLRKLATLLEVHPAEFFTDKIPDSRISAQELVTLIQQEYTARGLTLEQFEDLVGWTLRDYIDSPEKLLSDMSIDGLQWLCRELRIDWLRAL